VISAPTAPIDLRRAGMAGSYLRGKHVRRVIALYQLLPGDASWAILGAFFVRVGAESVPLAHIELWRLSGLLKGCCGADFTVYEPSMTLS